MINNKYILENLLKHKIIIKKIIFWDDTQEENLNINQIKMK